MHFMQEVLRNFFFSGILRIAAHAKTKSFNTCGSTVNSALMIDISIITGENNS